MKTLQTVTLLAGILASGLMAGLFVGFAYSVMPGLGRSSDRTMIEAMQNINKAIVTPWFLLLFAGPIPLLILAAVLAWRGQGRPALPWILAALALYLIAFLITGGVNVPLNDQLAEAGNPRHILDLSVAPALPGAELLPYWSVWVAPMVTLLPSPGLLKLSVTVPLL